MDKLILDGKQIENLNDAAKWLQEAWDCFELSIYYDENKNCLVIEDHEHDEITYVQSLAEFLLII